MSVYERTGNSVDWSYFGKFEWADNKYLPVRGEGETMATQLVTAATKLVYKWYNDGDVYDNTYYLSGWWNDLSSYANWLVKYIPEASCLHDISKIENQWQYEHILKELVEKTHIPEYLEALDQKKKVGSIYECDGPFRYVEYEDEDEDYEEFEDDEEDW